MSLDITEQSLEPPALYEFQTVHSDLVAKTHQELMLAMTKGFRNAVLTLLKTKTAQEKEADGILLRYMVGTDSAEDMLAGINTVLARFTGFRGFLLRVADFLVENGGTERTRTNVLAVEELLEADMNRIFRRTLTTASHANILLLWHDYTGFTHTPDPSAASPAETTEG